MSKRHGNVCNSLCEALFTQKSTYYGQGVYEKGKSLRIEKKYPLFGKTQEGREFHSLVMCGKKLAHFWANSCHKVIM